MLPGKKGISLTVEQYETLKYLIMAGHIDKEIATMSGE
jgi:Transcriptional Coactivator p15 (PC4)